MNDLVTELEKNYHQAEFSSKILFVEGESGVGKTYHIQKFLDLVKKQNIIKIDGYAYGQSSYLTINSAIEKLITEKDIKREARINILQKVAMWLPRFGQTFASLIDPNRKYLAYSDLIRRAGINTGAPNINRLINFLENLDSNKPILYCDNIQWFDLKSWEILLQILSCIDKRKWICILSYTTNAETLSLSHDRIKTDINQLKKNNPNNISIYKFKRYKKADIKKLCDSILRNKTSFSTSQYNLIFQYSQGIALYIKIILNSFLENGDIIFNNNEYISHCKTWNTPQIKRVLKHSIQSRIVNIYNNLPDSRKILEIGSVFKNNFSDEEIDQIFENDNSFDILKKVETKYKLVNYLSEYRAWEFEHSIVQNYIYTSLGKKKSQEIHLKIANFLSELNDDSCYSTIAYHYEKAGFYEKSCDYLIKDIRSLLKFGCYKSALENVYFLENKYSSEIFFDKNIHFCFLLAKGQALFHNIEYQSAIETFIELINYLAKEKIEEEILLGKCYQWLAKTYLKLESQDDFKKAEFYLEKAIYIFKGKKEYTEIGYILLDFIVAYAHMNDKEKAKQTYIETEQYLITTNDTLGKIRLHRKCIIFMEAKLAVKILERVAEKAYREKIPQEYIMALVNASAAYIEMMCYSEAKSLLEQAIEASIELDNFGFVYIHNNLSIINMQTKNFLVARQNIEEARRGKYRLVEQLIVNINGSVLIALEKGLNSSFRYFEENYKQALATKENAYLIPATVNWAIQNYEDNNVNICIELLENIEMSIQTYSKNYIFILWYETLCNALLHKEDTRKNSFSDKYKDMYQKCLRKYPEHPSYALITMEFWSDN